MATHEGPKFSFWNSGTLHASFLLARYTSFQACFPVDYFSSKIKCCRFSSCLCCQITFSKLLKLAYREHEVQLSQWNRKDRFPLASTGTFNYQASGHIFALSICSFKTFHNFSSKVCLCKLKTKIKVQKCVQKIEKKLCRMSAHTK